MELDCGPELAVGGGEVRFTVTAIDPGSDDLTFTWDWGDGSPTTARTYYNDGPSPDPYPSPGGTFPFMATDSQSQTYTMARTYDLKVIARDDDGGVIELIIVTVIS